MAKFATSNAARGCPSPRALAFSCSSRFGSASSFPSVCDSVAALLNELEYEGTHFAIALNYDVVPKSRWAETPLSAGDEIEIITPRQGG